MDFRLNLDASESQNADFWKQVWREGVIPFHQLQFHPILSQCIQSIGLNPGDNVFLPLCGKSLDLILLQDKGFQVFGVELSEIAVQTFFSEHQIKFERTKLRDNLFLYQSDDLHIYQGDFFSINSGEIPHIKFLFDRGSLVALPPPLRQRYAQKLNELKRDHGFHHLLITAEYDQNKMQGPPFSVPEAEVRKLFSFYSNFEVLEEYSTEANPEIKKKGLDEIQRKALLMS